MTENPFERWQRMMAQAARFASLDNAPEAVARSEQVMREVRRDIANLMTETEQRRAEAFADYVRQQRDAWSEAEAKRQDAIRARAEALRVREFELMDKPIPKVI